MKVDGHSHRTVANENDNEFDEETIRVFNRIILFSQRKAQLISGVPGNRKKGANVFSSQLVTGGSGRVQYQGEYLVRGEFRGRSAGSRTNKSRVTRYTSKQWQSEERNAVPESLLGQLGLLEDDSTEGTNGGLCGCWLCIHCQIFGGMDLQQGIFSSSGREGWRLNYMAM